MSDKPKVPIDQLPVYTKLAELEVKIDELNEQVKTIAGAVASLIEGLASQQEQKEQQMSPADAMGLMRQQMMANIMKNQGIRMGRMEQASAGGKPSGRKTTKSKK